jgi:hypothetical protein
MPMNKAQRRRLYRRRHHGPDADLAHVILDVRFDVRDQLNRLAWHYRCIVTQLAEVLAVTAERAVEAKLFGEALAPYRNVGFETRRCVSQFPGTVARTR